MNRESSTQMTVISEERLVSFSGLGSRRGPLSWGQLAICDEVAALGPQDASWNQARIIALDAGVSLVRVESAVHHLVAANEMLRTLFEMNPTTQRVEQCVQDSGRVRLWLYPADPGFESDVAHAARVSQGKTRFDISRDLPLIVGAVLNESNVSHLVLTAPHAAADRVAMNTLVSQLVNLVHGREDDCSDTLQPIDLALAETREPLASRGEKSIAHWRSLFMRMPPSIYDYPRREYDGHRYWRMGMVSPVLSVTAEMAGRRIGVSGSTVLIAATASVLARTTGHTIVPLMSVAANRWQRQTARTVACLVQDTCMLLTVASRDFDETVRRVNEQVLTAYRHSYYDPREWRKAYDDSMAERGSVLDLDANVNDARNRSTVAVLRELQAGEAVAAADKCEVQLLETGDVELTKFMLEYFGNDDVTRVELKCDRAYFDAASMEPILRAVQMIIVRAAFEVGIDVAEVFDAFGLHPPGQARGVSSSPQL
jgi:hypothetical protein